MRKNRKISIFYVIADSSLTGAPRHLLTLIHNLNHNRFAPSVILPPGPLVEKLKAHKIPIFQVPMRGKADTAAVNAVARLIDQYEPDIIHTHGQRGGLVGRLAARKKPVRVVHTEHTYTQEFKLSNPLLHWTHLRAKSVLNRWTDKIIAVSDAVRRFMIDSKLVHPDKVVTIYNGVTTKLPKIAEAEVVAFKEKFGIQKDDIVVGTIGSLNMAKDHGTLIRAFARMTGKWKNLKLVIIGKGPLKLPLEKLVQKLGLKDRVIFTGAVDNICPALKSFTVFVLPSRSEAFGLSLLEAMQVGLPIVAAKVGGIPEIIKHGYNGLLVPTGDPKTLASTLMKLLNDKALQRKLSKHHEEALGKFSSSTMVRSTEKIYEDLLKPL